MEPCVRGDLCSAPPVRASVAQTPALVMRCSLRFRAPCNRGLPIHDWERAPAELGDFRRRVPQWRHAGHNWVPGTPELHPAAMVVRRGEADLDLRDPRELERALCRNAACSGLAGTDCDRLFGSEELRGILDLLEPRRLRRFFGDSNSFLSTSLTSSLSDVSMSRTAHNTLPPSLFCAPVMLDLVLISSLLNGALPLS
jgi:hypothetical protein